MISATSLGLAQRMALTGPDTSSQTASKKTQADTNAAANNVATATDAQTSASTQVSLNSQMRNLMTALTYRPVSSKNNTSMLKQVSSGSDQRKAAARQRLKQLKEQIDSMKRFAVALNPRAAKAMAVLLKQLAQQVKAAAAELSTGSGGSSGGDMHIMPVASSGDSSGASSADAGASVAAAVSSSADTSGSDSAGTDNGGDAGSAADAQAAVAAAEQAATAASSADQASSAASGKSSDATGKSADASGKSGDASGAKTADKSTGSASKPSVNVNPGTGAKPDPQAAADADLIRKVAGSLKELMALVKLHLRGQPSKDMQSAEAAMKDVDKIVKDMTGNSGATGTLGGIGGTASALTVPLTSLMSSLNFG